MKNNNSVYSDKFAQFYDIFFKNKKDFNFYKYFIEQEKGLTLEIGCGTGRLLIEFLRNKIQIEGIEPSKDMIRICMQKGKKFGFEPIIYNQSLENMNLPKKYKIIILPLYVFQHIKDEDLVLKSLKNIYEHLENNGHVLISIFNSENISTKNWQIRSVETINDETFIMYERIKYNSIKKIENKEIKIEWLRLGNIIQTFITEIDFKIYSTEEIKNLLTKTGFCDIEIFVDYSLHKKNIEADTYIFKALKKN